MLSLGKKNLSQSIFYHGHFLGHPCSTDVKTKHGDTVICLLVSKRNSIHSSSFLLSALLYSLLPFQCHVLHRKHLLLLIPTWCFTIMAPGFHILAAYLTVSLSSHRPGTKKQQIHDSEWGWYYNWGTSKMLFPIISIKLFLVKWSGNLESCLPKTTPLS